MTAMQPESVTILLALNIALSMIAFLGGWLVKTLFDRIKDLEVADREIARALNDLRVELPSNYVSKVGIKEFADGIHTALRRIEDKLDHKVDKE